MKKCAKFCTKWNFVVFSFEKIVVINKDGKEKKKLIGLPADWTNCHNLDIHANHEAFGIVTGKRSGITVIDCDTDTAYSGVIRDYPELLDTLTVKTFKGYHIYTTYCPSINTDSSVFKKYPDVDIRNDGGFVVAPYSSYQINGSLFTYSAEGDSLCNYPISLIPDNPVIKTLKVKVTPKASDQIVDLCNIIDIKYLDDRSSWFRIVMALRSIAVPKEFIRELSAKSSHFTEDGFNEAYNSYDSNRKPKSKLGIPDVICFYSRSSNKNEYIKIMNKYIKFNGSNDDDIADVIEKLFGDNIIVDIDGIPFVYTGKYWKKDTNKAAISQIISEDLFQHYLLCLATAEDKEKSQINKAIVKCRNATGKSNIITIIKTKFFAPDIKFENNPFIFCFKNKVFDFKKNQWIDSSEKTDYMYLTTGYDYRESTSVELATIQSIINSIFPDEDTRDCYLQILASGMIGINPELFVMAEGAGSNGKSLIHDLISVMLGDGYYKPLDVNVLLDDIKSGANPAVASLNDSRCVVAREPSEDANFCFASIKKLTGGEEVTARNLYSEKMTTTMKGTLILECNDRPNIPGTIGNDIRRRLIDIPFRSTFTNDPELLKHPGHFPGKTQYKEHSFKINHRCALFEILKPYAVKFANTRKIAIPKSVSDETKSYLGNTNTVCEWFNETYERDEAGVVKLIDIKHKFTDDRVRTNRDRKKYSSKEKVLKNLLAIENLGYYKGKGKEPAVLLGWKLKILDEPASIEL